MQKKAIQREASNWAVDNFDDWIGNATEWTFLLDEIGRIIDEEPIRSATDAVVRALNNLRFLSTFRRAC